MTDFAISKLISNKDSLIEKINKPSIDKLNKLESAESKAINKSKELTKIMGTIMTLKSNVSLFREYFMNPLRKTKTIVQTSEAFGLKEPTQFIEVMSSHNNSDMETSKISVLAKATKSRIVIDLRLPKVAPNNQTQHDIDNIPLGYEGTLAAKVGQDPKGNTLTDNIIISKNDTAASFTKKINAKFALHRNDLNNPYYKAKVISNQGKISIEITATNTGNDIITKENYEEYLNKQPESDISENDYDKSSSSPVQLNNISSDSSISNSKINVIDSNIESKSDIENKNFIQQKVEADDYNELSIINQNSFYSDVSNNNIIDNNKNDFIEDNNNSIYIWSKSNDNSPDIKITAVDGKDSKVMYNERIFHRSSNIIRDLIPGVIIKLNQANSINNTDDTYHYQTIKHHQDPEPFIKHLQNILKDYNTLADIVAINKDNHNDNYMPIENIHGNDNILNGEPILKQLEDALHSFIQPASGGNKFASILNLGLHIKPIKITTETGDSVISYRLVPSENPKFTLDEMFNIETNRKELENSFINNAICESKGSSGSKISLVNLGNNIDPKILNKPIELEFDVKSVNIPGKNDEQQQQFNISNIKLIINDHNRKLTISKNSYKNLASVDTQNGYTYITFNEGPLKGTKLVYIPAIEEIKEKNQEKYSITINKGIADNFANNLNKLVNPNLSSGVIVESLKLEKDNIIQIKQNQEKLNNLIEEKQKEIEQMFSKLQAIETILEQKINMINALFGNNKE